MKSSSRCSRIPDDSRPLDAWDVANREHIAFTELMHTLGSLRAFPHGVDENSHDSLDWKRPARVATRPFRLRVMAPLQAGPHPRSGGYAPPRDTLCELFLDGDTWVWTRSILDAQTNVPAMHERLPLR